tara:strand:- start:753 stop:1145 length:393 start_codon:yes stop_codon:yes gene_type:complete
MLAFEGLVVRGDGRGKELGFPTANVRMDKQVGDLEGSALGVYIARVEIAGDVKKGVANIGKKPTFNRGDTLSLEVHIPGFTGELYGQKMKVELLKHLREEVAFSSVNELKKQISADVKQATQYKILEQNT